MSQKRQIPSQQSMSSSIRELQSRPSIHRNCEHNSSDDQNCPRTRMRSKKQNSSKKDDPQQNSSSQSESELEDSDMDNESINCSNQEQSDLDSSSELQEEQKSEGPIYREKRFRYIPESAVYGKLQGLDEEPSIDSSYNENRSVSITRQKVSPQELKKSKLRIVKVICGLVVLVIAGALGGPLLLSEAKRDILTEIKENFTTQDDELWNAFEAGVDDVVHRKRPSTFILMYQQEAEHTLNDIVQQLSKYAACNITGCGKKAIELTEAELNPPAIREYGTIIATYRPQLEKQGIMIVKNLEKVYGTSALAFHTFCDEFTPLVEKSLFIFTVRVDQLPASSDRMKFIEEFLKNKWTDIKSDVLNPLITRITSMVLEVRA